MSTTPIGQTTSTPDVSTASSATGNSTMGKDAFLQLLVTQLQHQDPTQPQDDSQFVAQLAQFSSLESLQNMQQTLGDIDTKIGASAAATSAAASSAAAAAATGTTPATGTTDSTGATTGSTVNAVA